MRPHIAVIVLCLGVGLAMLLARCWQEWDYRRQLQYANHQGGSNLKMLALALHEYADAHKHRLPASAIFSKDGKPLLSWRVAVLPYIEQKTLYDLFRLDEPWNSPHNIKLLPHMPPVFEFYGDHRTRLPNKTYFQVFVGPGAAFEGTKGLLLPGWDFPDGTSNTIAIIEAANPVYWSAPQELVYSPNEPLPAVGGHFRDSFLLALADGSFERLSTKTNPAALRAAITRNGGEKLRKVNIDPVNFRLAAFELED